MSVHVLEQLLYDLSTSGAQRRRYLEDRGAVLDRYPLDEEERRLVSEEEVGRLFELGVNPMLLMGFYLGLHGPKAMPAYLEKMPTLASRLGG